MQLNRFAKFVWAVLAINLLVILWGAYVRASGSGAGCGSHWPLCNGEVLPRAPQIKTIVEFTHRLSSGIALLMVVGLAFGSRRFFPRGHIVRRGAALSLFFMLTEALVGAGLVLFELVAENKSMARAMFMSVHLVNTFLLIATISLTAWWASGGERPELRGHSTIKLALLLSLISTLILGVSGAVTALGDTLFPAGSLAAGLKQDFSSTAHLLLRLRIFHPMIALFTVAISIFTALLVLKEEVDIWAKRFAYQLAVLSIIQIGLGLINVYLLAPIWLQLLHLLVADLVWITLILMATVALAKTKLEKERLQSPISSPQLVGK